MRGEKGITLIALVITIIVMLILVGVTISFAINGGLFGNAQESSKAYRTSQINEAIALTKADLYSEYYSTGTNATGDNIMTAETAEQVVARINKYLTDSGLEVKADGDAVTTNKGTTYKLKSESDNIDSSKMTKTIECDFWTTTPSNP